MFCLQFNKYQLIKIKIKKTVKDFQKIIRYFLDAFLPMVSLDVYMILNVSPLFRLFLSLNGKKLFLC